MPLEKTKTQWQYIKRTYGLTQEQYNALDFGFCPICLRVWSNNVRPCVDHDHGSRDDVPFVRGIVCLYCNRIRIGRFRDHELVQRIADYLKTAPRHLIVPERNKRKKKIVKNNPSYS